MPQISEFYGIVIYMYYRDHAPPHFHAIYSGDEAEISINSPALLTGHLPPRAMRMAMEWASLRRIELLRVWKQARLHRPLGRVQPLE